MSVNINGTTGVSLTQDSTISQGKLAPNVAGNGPCFSASLGSALTVVSNTYTKIPLNAKSFDTTNAFDSVTNYRFQPLVSGYYQFNAYSIFVSSTNNLQLAEIAFSKNGGGALAGSSYTYIAAGGIAQITGTVAYLIYLNGSTDYVELTGRIVGAGTLTVNGATLQGFLARAA